MNKNFKKVVVILVVTLGIVSFGAGVNAYASRGGGTQIGFSLEQNEDGK